MKKKVIMWIVWHLPLKIILWSVIRAMAIATTESYRDKTPDEITYSMLWKALDGDRIMN